MELATYRRTTKQRMGLLGEECPHCGVKIFPPRDICPQCRGEAKEPFAFSGTGKIYSYSTMYSAPERFGEYVPYVVALVQLDEGPMVTAQLTDVLPEEVSIGMRVEMVTRKMYEEGEDGIIIYNYKFRPQPQELAHLA